MPYIPGRGWVAGGGFVSGTAGPGTGGAANTQDYYGNTQDLAGVLGQVGSAAPSVGQNAWQNEIGQGAGQIFGQARESQAVNALNAGISNNEGDVNLRDQLRAQLSAQYNQFNPEAQYGNLNSAYDKSLNNSLSMARRQLAGTGLSGSAQAGRGLGDVISQSNQARLQGMAGLQNQQAQTLGALGQTQGNVLQQSLQERGYNFQQAKSLSDLLENQAQTQYNFLNANRDTPGPSGLDKALGYGLSGLGTVASAGGRNGFNIF